MTGRLTDEPEIVTLLLDAGESAEKPVADFGSGLHIAIDAGHPSMVKLLLARGVSLTSRDGKGRTPPVLAQEELADALARSADEKVVQNRREIVGLLKAAEGRSVVALGARRLNDGQFDFRG